MKAKSATSSQHHPSDDPADPDQCKKLSGDADDDDERARGNRPATESGRLTRRSAAQEEDRD
ncbi:MAG TPA: hypothetical protein VKC63_07550, partial [Solirubrobacterales bacterium]|nr:hypothetical protein [Solirubrobacterales bacterium]